MAHSLLRHLDGKEALGQILEDYYISPQYGRPVGLAKVRTNSRPAPDVQPLSNSGLHCPIPIGAAADRGLPLRERHHPPEDLVE